MPYWHPRAPKKVRPASVVSTPGRDCKGTVETLYNNQQGKASMKTLHTMKLVPNEELVTIVIDHISYIYEDRHNECQTFVVMNNGLVLCVYEHFQNINSALMRGF